MNDAMAPDALTAPPPSTAQKLAAEALGTFVLVLLGCGSLILASSASGFGDANIVSVGLTFGLAVMVMIYAVGRISGGHFNPAITVGAALSGRMSWKEVPPYVGAQVGGGLLGAAVLLVLALGNDDFEAFDSRSGNLAANGWGDDGTGYPLWAALLVEIVLTLLLVLVVLAVTDERAEHPGFAPLAIGLTLAALHFASIPLTGTSVNPARSIGPALLSGSDPIIQVWVFIVAPLIGGGLAGLAYPALFGHDRTPVEGSGLHLARSSASPQGYSQQQWSQPRPGGYAPMQQGYPAATVAPAPVEQPIIQDGWQWDPQAQQWIPAQQAPPQPQAPGWPTPGEGGQTQVRPPDGF